MVVSIGRAGRYGGSLGLDLDARVDRVLGDNDRCGEILECASDLGDHQVTGGYSKIGVKVVDLPGTGNGHLSAFDISRG